MLINYNYNTVNSLIHHRIIHHRTQIIITIFSINFEGDEQDIDNKTENKFYFLMIEKLQQK